MRISFVDALIEVVSEGGVGDPFKVAEKAASEKASFDRARRRRGGDSFEASDEFWAVFDRDDHERFDQAIRLCVEKNVSVARSNPCFEVWLILHKQDFERPDDRHEVQRHLECLCPEYRRTGSKAVDGRAMISGLAVAIDRARQQLLNREAEGDPFGRPSTTVHELADRIRQAASSR